MGMTSLMIAAGRSSHGRAYDRKQSTTRIAWTRFVFISLFNKEQEHVFRIMFSFWYFWSLTIQVEIEKNDGQVMPKNMRATSLQHLYKFLLKEHLKKEA
jgi:hypothetical protein